MRHQGGRRQNLQVMRSLVGLFGDHAVIVRRSVGDRSGIVWDVFLVFWFSCSSNFRVFVFSDFLVFSFYHFLVFSFSFSSSFSSLSLSLSRPSFRRAAWVHVDPRDACRRE